ncbi:hypothetical protein E1H12_17965, partial [Geitlerinema sp. P-1104]|uniref:acyltransferase family protein n=1 Tax=Geitlerinema sp. P-1104 TaxID=2546230 RepID=UPI00147713B0
PYYLLFTWTRQFKFRTFISINCTLLLIGIVLKLVLQSSPINVGDVRILLHYPTFLFGVVVGTFDPDLLWVKAKSNWLVILFGLPAIAYISVVGRDNINLGHALTLGWHSFLHYGYCVVWSLFIISLVFGVMNQFSEQVKNHKSINHLSGTSYAVYLFHRPIYGLIYGSLIALNLDSILIQTLLFPVVTLLLFVVSDHLTRLDLQVIKPCLTQVLSSESR